jgi:hypothetical protein
MRVQYKNTPGRASNRYQHNQSNRALHMGPVGVLCSCSPVHGQACPRIPLSPLPAHTTAHDSSSSVLCPVVVVRSLASPTGSPDLHSFGHY